MKIKSEPSTRATGAKPNSAAMNRVADGYYAAIEYRHVYPPNSMVLRRHHERSMAKSSPKSVAWNMRR